MTTTIANQTSPAPQRKGVNVIIPGSVLQRGQILSWSLDEKREFFKTHNIGLVVNFWSKLDADLSECWDVTYVYCPRPASKGMLNSDINVLVGYVKHWVQTRNKTVLILCEAGRTRSVYFTILLVSALLGIPLREAYKQVDERLSGKHSLKGFMLDRINE